MASRDYNTIKGAWTLEEDRKLSEYIEVHGAKKWKIVATKTGLNRSPKSCRFRWLNYLRPNIKRGNITDQEEDLILRLHKLIGNRWSLIAGRLPGRTDNEIKNYWNSHLSKKVNKKKAITVSSLIQDSRSQKDDCVEDLGVNRNTKDDACKGYGDTENSFNVDELLDFSNEGSFNLQWVSEFLELD
ncbi:hypothetical protein GIB67_037829 [Kingdonia uniflora]|uniref:Uncharacterized protein n=1 Tax=Kingdonia uniflora TaxID=39325 RepID=A0A7J7LBP4_9MAGN|nr:hypothetical protein GIB67_037829 [Kingdonia uniflora]